jgi:hypothetical protein
MSLESTEKKPVKWPQGYDAEKAFIRNNAGKILSGRLLAIDPGSTSPGYALYEAGKLVKSGTIKVPSFAIHQRLPYIYDRISELVGAGVQIFVIEDIKGQNFSHRYLLWSIGCAIAAARAPLMIGIPSNMWKPLAKVSDWYTVKNDENDARALAETTIRLAKELILKE